MDTGFVGHYIGVRREAWALQADAAACMAAFITKAYHQKNKSTVDKQYENVV